MITVKKIYNGPVNGEWEVTIDLTKEQSEELRKALAVVQRYEKQALKSAEVSKKDADWTMFSYAVKNNKVVVNIQDGACG